jgi:hypothetical protein
MKVENIKSGVFYVAQAPYNWNTLIISDVGTFGPLRILANWEKYFNTYKPSFKYYNGKSFSSVSMSALKKDFQHALRTDPGYFSKTEIERLAKMFNIKIGGLAESSSCKRVKGYKKPSIGKRVKTYARKKTR